MAEDKGTLVLLKVDSGLLIGQNSLSFNSVSTMIETSNKTSGNYSTFLSGRINQTLSVGGIGAQSEEATAKGYWDLKALQDAGEPFAATFTKYTTEAGTTPVVGAEMITAQVLISNLTLEAPDNDAMTYSCDLQVTGEPTQATNSGV